MGNSWEQTGLRIIRGDARGPLPALARWGLAAASGVYANVIRARNTKYDKGLGVKRLPKPVISIGNLTTGGTGKTPVVRWLCERLKASGGRPAVLMRGYKAAPGQRGDEQAMLEGLLDGVPVQANPSRHAGALAILAEHPDVSVFVLDDGFQHRRLARDFDLVLIDASEPFGFGRVLPRGLLREPTSGLSRADAILITRADQGKDVEALVRQIQSLNTRAPVYRCTHAHVGLRDADGSLHPMEWLAGKRFFAFAGIGNPTGFERQLNATPGTLAGHHWFGDHWNYSPGDLEIVQFKARQSAVEVVVTTEKDWVKIRPFRGGLPLLRVELAVKFAADDESKLLRQIEERVRTAHR